MCAYVYVSLFYYFHLFVKLQKSSFTIDLCMLVSFGLYTLLVCKVYYVCNSVIIHALIWTTINQFKVISPGQ